MPCWFSSSSSCSRRLPTAYGRSSKPPSFIVIIVVCVCVMDVLREVYTDRAANQAVSQKCLFPTDSHYKRQLSETVDRNVINVMNFETMKI